MTQSITPAATAPAIEAEALGPRDYPAAPILSVSLAVFRAGRVLLATRTRPPFVGQFSLPGGGVEAGETLIDAALRELREEVAVEARVIAFNRHVESIERDAAGAIRRHFVIASFAAEWIAGEGTPGPEAGEIIWADRRRTRHAPLHAADSRRCRERGRDPRFALLKRTGLVAGRFQPVANWPRVFFPIRTEPREALFILMCFINSITHISENTVHIDRLLNRRGRW